MRSIDLWWGRGSKRRIVEQTIVDDCDFEYLNKSRWGVQKAGVGLYYAGRVEHIAGKTINIYLHRQILERKLGCLLRPFPIEQVDHIDRDKLNNQRSNLRLATYSQQGQNTGKYSNSSSVFRGVCWNSARRKWQAQLRVNGRLKYLGLFIEESGAARAYDDAVTCVYDLNFAQTNSRLGLLKTLVPGPNDLPTVLV